MSNFENNMTQGSVFRKLVQFALPFMISNIVQSLYNVADMLIVGNFCGKESMSGVNIGGQVTFILTHVVIGLSMGATILIGQYLGAGKREEMKKVTATILTVLLALSVVLTPLMLFLKEPLLALIQTPVESYSESADYLSITVVGLVFVFGYNALSAILRGMGDSRRPLYFVAIACVLNIALDLLFVGVFGWAAKGAALATVVSQGVSMLLCILYMVKNKFHFNFKLTSFRIDKQSLKDIFKIGLPTCVQNTVVSFSFLFITALVNSVGGVDASAALGAVSKLNGFAIMPAIAMGASISTLSAQNFGANQLDRAVKACKIGIVAAFAISAMVFTVVQLFPGRILALFDDDPQMIADGIAYLRTFSYDYLIVPFVFCLNSLYNGGGHTLFSLVTSLTSSLLLRVPASFFFGSVMSLGMQGVGLGAPVASAGSLLLCLGFLLSGRWKQNKVRLVSIDNL